MLKRKAVVSESWTRSPYETIDICHVWTIEKFSRRKETVLLSDPFSSSLDNDTQHLGKKTEFCMQFHTKRVKNISRQESEFTQLVVQVFFVNPGNKAILDLFCTFSLRNEQGVCLKTSRKIHKNTSKLHAHWGVHHIFKMDDLLDKLPNDVLKIKCKLSYVKKISNVSGIGKDEEPARKKPKCNLSDNLGALLTDDDFSDVTFCVGTVQKTEFKAHKVILAARSSYFTAMFKSDFREKRENVIEIKDINPAIFKEILAFIYTGKVPKNLAESAKEILEAADRFNLEILKCLAEDFLTSKLTIENASELLVLADRHSANILKNRVTKYVAANLKEVMKTEGWDILNQEHTHLTKEPILKAIDGSSSK